MVPRLSGAGGGDGLPKHYVEVGKLLLGRAGGDFGSEAYQVKSLLEEIRVLRFRKAQDGMKVLIDNFSEEQAGIDVSDFSMMEMNLVREFLLGSLDKIHKLWWGKRGSGEGEGSGGGAPKSQEPQQHWQRSPRRTGRSAAASSDEDPHWAGAGGERRGRGNHLLQRPRRRGAVLFFFFAPHTIKKKCC